jgi:hypothetical protein
MWMFRCPPTIRLLLLLIMLILRMNGPSTFLDQPLQNARLPRDLARKRNRTPLRHELTRKRSRTRAKAHTRSLNILIGAMSNIGATAFSTGRGNTGNDLAPWPPSSRKEIWAWKSNLRLPKHTISEDCSGNNDRQK